jgi:hypothetical protein
MTANLVKSSTRFLSIRNALSKDAPISASVPVALAGSGVFQCSFLALPYRSVLSMDKLH